MSSVGRYWVRLGGREVPLGPEGMFIGRGEGCQIVVREGLVSRRHARLSLEGERPFIEDLGSANGTFVNQARLHGRAHLFPGDRVFIGTVEIEIVCRTDGDSPDHGAGDALDRPTPSSGVQSFPPPRGGGGARSSRRVGRAPGGSADPLETTTEAGGLEYLGHLADKMFTMGRVDAALKILSEHLEQILGAARSGQTLEASVVDSAGRYALKLAHETLDARWVNVAIEIHLHTSRPLCDDTLQRLAALRAKAPMGDDELLGRYYQRLRSQLLRMSPAERLLCERVACLIPGLADGS